MEYILRRVHRAGIFGWLYVMTLFHAFHFYAVHFINSSFLETYLSQDQVGFMVAVSNALTLIVLLTTVLFLKQIGNYYTALIVTGINFIATLGLALITDIGWVFIFYVLHTIMLPVTLFCFDVFIESFTKDESTTGSIRGFFLTISLFAALIAPIVSGQIVGASNSYRYVYLAGALYLIPVLTLLVIRFRTFTDPQYNVLSLSEMVRSLRSNRDIFHVTMAHFFLRFYFSWMVVYMPIYLHQVIGFSWVDIGYILFFMVIPYVLIEYPAGIIADRYLGEKELMVTGFLITGVTTLGIFFLTSTNILVWSLALFMTRVGCAFVESMTETYFFKQIDGDDTSILSIFRMLRPLAYTVGPFSAGVLLYFVSGNMGLQYLWLILGIFTFFGIINAVSLKDSR